VVKLAISLGMLNPSLWVQVTEEADRLGFESVWLPEHLVIPVQMGGSPYAGQEHPPIPPQVPVFDAFTYLGFLAGRTSDIRFCTHVYNIGLRHPFISARAVATLDVVSGGRAMFGIGASWLEAEWEAVGLDFHTRGRRVDEALNVCRRLWSEEVIEHHGEFFDFNPVMFEPKPIQRPWPPIHVGGDGPAALRRAAVAGDGWIPMNHTLEQIPPAVARLAELRDAAGRDGKVEVTIGGPIAAPSDVERYADAGVDRVIVRPWQKSKEAIDGIRRFADEVLTKL
jgi:probable F420-dependent oxidoreductase